MYASVLANIKFCFIVIVVNIVSLLSGMMLTWPSPVLPKLSSNASLNENPLGRIITSNEQSWIAALSSIGGIFGPFLSGFVMEKFGRKFALVSAHFPNIISTLTAAFGNNIWYFYISRVAAGMSINAGIAMGAVYFGEIGKSHNRGMLFSTTSIFINLGTLLSYCIGPYTSIRNFNLIILGIVLVGFFCTLFFVPESPYFLLQKQQLQKAVQSLEILRGTTDIQDEIKIIEKNVSNSTKIRNDGILGIFKTKAARRSFLIALILVTLQQFSGISAIYAYTQTIFEQSGSQLSSDVSSILVGVAQLITICVTTFGVDKFGRKRMLMFASTGLAFSLGVLGIYYQFQNTHLEGKINWLPLVCLMLFFVFFNSGMGSLPFLYMSEILPLNIKSVSTSIIMANFGLVGFLITFFYNSMTESMGASGIFYLYASAMVTFCLYVFLVLFETKGKTLQEINERLNASVRSKNMF